MHICGLNIKHTIITIVCFFGFATVYAQDPLLSIKAATPTYWNPANTGHELYSRIALDYRNDFPTIGNEYVTYTGTFDTYFADINSGLGIMLMMDKFGPALSYNAANLAYSYRIQLRENKYLKLGLGANLHYSVRDPNKLIFPDMLNNDGTNLPTDVFYDKLSNFGVDFNFGVKYGTEVFSAEASISHLGSQPDSVFWNRPLRFYGQVEFNIPLFSGRDYSQTGSFRSLLRRTVIKPSVFFMKQDKTDYLSIGAYLQMSNLNLGFYSRQNLKFNTVIFSALLGYSSDYFEINYMIDLGRISARYYGMPTSSHEISVIIKIPNSNADY